MASLSASRTVIVAVGPVYSFSAGALATVAGMHGRGVDAGSGPGSAVIGSGSSLVIGKTSSADASSPSASRMAIG